MKKGVSFVWDQSCQMAFEEIKNYFTNPSVLAALVAEKLFQLYARAMHHSLGALVAQHNDEGHEQVVHYLRRTMIGAYSKYNPIKKECLALEFTI